VPHPFSNLLLDGAGIFYYDSRMSKPVPVNETEIKTLLEGRRGDWSAIASSSGVSHSWLSKFVNGHIDNPGINTLRKVRTAIAANDSKKQRA
jgi:transcriptional regulator with XRE-family HTH domain